jgi:cytochrome c peroxidase
LGGRFILEIRMRALLGLCELAGLTLGLFTAMGGAAAIASESTTGTLTPQVLEEIAQVEAEIDRFEAQTIDRLANPPDNQVQQSCTTKSSR